MRKDAPMITEGQTVCACGGYRKPLTFYVSEVAPLEQNCDLKFNVY